MGTIHDPQDIPLSYLQENLWLHQQLADPDEPAYNESVAFELTGPIDSGALRTAVHTTIMRHDALRMRFYETGDGPRAEVVAAVPDTMTVVDLSGSGTGVARARAEELLVEHSHRPFDLGTAPLVRTILVALPGDVWLLSLTAHHIVIDDWSVRVIHEEIGERYQTIVASGRQPPAAPSAVGFRDFVRRTRAAFEEGRHADQIERWRRSLEDSPQLLGMPLDRPRPAQQTFRGSSLTVTAQRTDVEPFLDMCRRESGSTAFPAFLAAYAVLLNRYTGQDGFAIGTTVLNRVTEDDLAVVGCCVNTLPLYVPVDQDATFRQLLIAAQQATDRLLDDGDAPYPKVLEAVGAERAVSYNPVFQTMLTLLGPRPVLELGSGVVAQYRHIRRAAAKFDLTVYISHSEDEYQFEVEFNTDLFDPGTAERFLRNYTQLLKSLATDLDAPVSRPAMLREEDERLILDSWNDTAVAYPAATIVDMFEAQVHRSPDGIAVERDGLRLTYDLLNRKANQVARSLRRTIAGVDAVPFVGVYMERSVELVVALLAVVKAGYAYVPLDPEYPVARIELMVQDAGLPLVLTQQQHRDPLDAMGVPVLVLPDSAAAAEDDSDIGCRLSPESPVYMIYTSGSTGQPKGVVNRHDSVFNRLYWMQSTFALSGDDKVLQKTPYSFDVSVWEFFWPLMAGATIVLAEPGGHRDPDYLKQVIRAHDVTTVHFVPSMLSAFLEAEDLAWYCGPLQRVLCSGEALPRKTMEVFFATLSCELHNLYGPTEAAIDVSHWPCTLDYPGEIVPIGKPIANVRLYVLDRHQVLQPVGVPGELCIGGVAVASGYHRRDQLSRRAFIEDPYGPQPGGRLYRTGDLARFLPDGQIQYLGRIDDQVKLRGLRVEPAEVAAVLRELPGVQDGAVVVHTSGSVQALAAYVVTAGSDHGASPDHDGGPGHDEIRTGLRRLLPEFLVPQFIVDVPALPTTPNGKLDRRALPDPVETAVGHDRPPLTTAAEHHVAGIWREVLDIDAVFADSAFFALGGDSILALRVAARLREDGYTVAVRDVFAHPTLAEFAASLQRDPDRADAASAPAFALVDAADRALLPRDAEDAWPLTTLQAGMIYHTLLDERSPVYHDIFDYEISGPVEPATVRQAVRTAVAGHAQLRSLFDLERYSEPLQVVLPAAEVPVTVVDIAQTERSRQDEVIDDWREHEKRRPIDLGGPLIRFTVHLRGNDRMNLGVSFHHLILDGWSVALVVEEIRHRCAHLLTGGSAVRSVPTASYGTYVALERESVRRTEDRDAWQKLLTGFPATLIASPRPAVGGVAEPATRERTVPPDLDDRLRRRAASLGVPMKSLYLSAHGAALADHMIASRVVTGLVSNGRPEIPGGGEMVGLFLNTVPFPIEVTGTPGADLIESVFDQERALIPYQRFPLARIEQLCGGAMFDVVFNYTDFHVHAAADDEPVRIEGAAYFELTSFPMVVHVYRDRFANSTQLAVSHDLRSIKSAVVDRFLDSFLAALEAVAAPGAEDGAPDEDARAIAGIVAAAIGLDALDVDVSYLDAGVDSITAIRVLAKLRRRFPAATMSDVIEARTARALARRLRARDDVSMVDATEHAAADLAGTDGLPEGAVDAYPATATQLQMIRSTRSDPAQSAFHDVFAYTVALPLDESGLRSALRTMTDACETLRTAFLLDATPVPLQVVYGSVEPDLTVVDAVDAADAVDEWFDSQRGSGFVWDRPGLIRYAAHRTGDAGFILTLSFHHSIIDGWSLSLLIRDLLTSYAAGLAGEGHHPAARPALAYRDYVKVETAAQSSAESQTHWRDVLADHPGTTLPRYRPDATGRRWTEATVVVPPQQEARLRSIAQHAGYPLKHLLLATHLRSLALITGDSDVVTGVFTHGRLEVEGGDRMIGMFLNFLPHRSRLRDQTWPELIEQVFRFEARALPHRRYPAAAIACDLGRAQPFPSLFNYTEFPAYADVAGNGRHITGVRWFEHVDVPLLINIGRDISQSALEVTVNADGRVVPQEVTDAVTRLHLAVLAHITTQPGARVLELSDEIRAALEDLRPEGNEQQ